MKHLLLLVDDLEAGSALQTFIGTISSALKARGGDVVVGSASVVRGSKPVDVRPIVPSLACIEALAENMQADAIISMSPTLTICLASSSLRCQRWCWHAAGELDEPEAETLAVTALASVKSRQSARRFYLEEVFPYLSGSIFTSEYARFTSRHDCSYKVTLSADYICPSGPKQSFDLLHMSGSIPKRLRVGTVVGFAGSSSSKMDLEPFAALIHAARERLLLDVISFNYLIAKASRPQLVELPRDVEVHTAITTAERAEYLRSLDIFIPIGFGKGSEILVMEAQRLGTLSLVPEYSPLSEFSPFTARSIDEKLQMISRYSFERTLLLKHSRQAYLFAHNSPSSEDILTALIRIVDLYDADGARRDKWFNPRLPQGAQSADTHGNWIPYCGYSELDAEKLIDKIYLLALGRSADPAGLYHYGRALNGGATVSEVLDMVFGSEEFTSAYPGVSRSSWIRKWLGADCGGAAGKDAVVQELIASEPAPDRDEHPIDAGKDPSKDSDAIKSVGSREEPSAEESGTEHEFGTGDPLSISGRMFGAGWYFMESTPESGRFRWMGNRGILVLPADHQIAGKIIRLSGPMRMAGVTPENISVRLNSQKMGIFDVELRGEQRWSFAFRVTEVSDGIEARTLVLESPSFQPPGDERHLSIAISTIQVEENFGVARATEGMPSLNGQFDSASHQSLVLGLPGRPERVRNRREKRPLKKAAKKLNHL